MNSLAIIVLQKKTRKYFLSKMHGNLFEALLWPVTWSCTPFSRTEHHIFVKMCLLSTDRGPIPTIMRGHTLSIFPYADPIDHFATFSVLKP